MDKFNPYDPYTSNYQQYSGQYQNMTNTYQYVYAYQSSRPFSRAGERPSHQYMGMGDFVVSDGDEYEIKERGKKEDDFIISDDVKSSDAPSAEYSTDIDPDNYTYPVSLKEDIVIKVTKRVKLGESVKVFEIPISNETYLFWAQKYNDRHGLGEATLTKRRGRPKKDNVMSLLNACKRSK